MHNLPCRRWLSRWVLAGFVLLLGASAVAPVYSQGGYVERICSAQAAEQGRWVFVPHGLLADQSPHGLECPLCLLPMALGNAVATPTEKAWAGPSYDWALTDDVRGEDRVRTHEARAPPGISL